KQQHLMPAIALAYQVGNAVDEVQFVDDVDRRQELLKAPVGEGVRAVAVGRLALADEQARLLFDEVAEAGSLLQVVVEMPAQYGEDRKSTRLNSSHVKI